MSDSLEQITTLWEEFQSQPFPSELHDHKYNDLELELTNTFVAGCISNFISNQGLLNDEKIQILKQFKVDYFTIAERLNVSPNRIYFKMLYKLADQIVNYTSHQTKKN